MPECEMCGKQVGTRRYLVEGTVMSLGLECSKYGTPLDTPAPQGTPAAMHQNLARRDTRMASRSVFDQQEQVTLVDGYGPRIHKAREAKGMSYEQLGDKVSARVTELKHIEAGKLRPGDDLTRRLEKVLGITLLEKIEATAPAISGQKKATAGSSLTIGDILRDAMDKKK